MIARAGFYTLLGNAATGTGVVVLGTHSVLGISAGMASAAIQFRSDGLLRTKENLTWTSLTGEWLATTPDTAAAALYQIYAEVLYTTAPISGTTNTWLPATVGPTFTMFCNVTGTENTCTMNMKIRLASSLAVVTQADVTLTAQSI